METLIVLIKLLCAHFFADFTLQTDRINKGKYKSGISGLFTSSQYSTRMYSLFVGSRLVMLAYSNHSIYQPFLN